MTSRFQLAVPAPFRLDFTVWLLRRRARNAIDRWDGVRYSRVVVLDGAPVKVEISQISPIDDPRIEITCDRPAPTGLRERLTGLVARLLGLDVDLAGFYRMALNDPLLNTLARRFVGFRPPRFPTIFEAAVNAVACQQLSLEVGLELLNRLAAAARPDVAHDALPLAFPQPREVGALTEERLRELGFSRQKTSALLNLARVLAEDEGYLERLAHHDDDAARQQAMRLKGIGRWSADYILLRGLGRLDVFPAGDIAAEKSLTNLLGCDASRKHSARSQLHLRLRRWHPYEGLIYFHLLLDNLERRRIFPTLNPNLLSPTCESWFER